MAERMHLQHFHTKSASTLTDSTKIYDGEIAVVATVGQEKLIIKNANSAITTFSSDAHNEAKFSGTGHSHNASSITGGTFDAARIPTGITVSKANQATSATTADKVQSAITFSEGKYSGTITYSGNSAPTVNIPTKTSDLENDSKFITGYTEAYKGTVTGITAGSGLTGGGSASNGSTGLTLNVGEGTGISVSADQVSISQEYLNKIASGVTANERIAAFLDTSGTTAALDSLIEIQNYLNEHATAASNMMTAITANEKAITAETKAREDADKAITGQMATDKAELEGKISKAATAYTGTVTSVTVNGASGLTGSGTVTSGGTITLGHSTSSGTTTTGTSTLSHSGTFVVPELTRDAYGHVTGLKNITYTLPADLNTDSATTENGHYTPSTTSVTSGGNGYHITSISLDSKKHVVGMSTASTAHTHSEYVNQNAFSKVIVSEGSTNSTLEAESATDTLTIAAGNFINITADINNDKLTIALENVISCGTF